MGSKEKCKKEFMPYETYISLPEKEKEQYEVIDVKTKVKKNEEGKIVPTNIKNANKAFNKGVKKNRPTEGSNKRKIKRRKKKCVTQINAQEKIIKESVH